MQQYFHIAIVASLLFMTLRLVVFAHDISANPKTTLMRDAIFAAGSAALAMFIIEPGRAKQIPVLTNDPNF